MPRKRSRVPSYRLHKPSGQARVIINGQHIYLGRFGSRESREKYSRLIAELAATSAPESVGPDTRDSNHDLSVNELLLAYWRFAESYYSKDGVPTKELACMRDALRPVRKLYGGSCARRFRPESPENDSAVYGRPRAFAVPNQPQGRKNQAGIQMGGS